MDLEAKRFGDGPRELGGAADLISQFKLWPHYESFCRKSIPLSISETHYLHNVVGDTEIRKGEGMELDQLFRNASHSRERNTHMHLFDLDILRDAFRMRETTSVNLHFAEKGIPTSGVKLKSELKEEERKRKRLKSKVKKDKKDHKKHSERQKDKSSHMEKRRDFSRGSTLESLKKPWDNKSRLDGFEGLSVHGSQRSMVTEGSGQRECWGNSR